LEKDPGAGAHSCNPTYSGGREQEDRSRSQLRQTVRPNLENTHHKKGLVEWLKVEALSSNPVLQKRLGKEET
jgi:hypothetical protein